MIKFFITFVLTVLLSGVLAFADSVGYKKEFLDHFIVLNLQSNNKNIGQLIHSSEDFEKHNFAVVYFQKGKAKDVVGLAESLNVELFPSHLTSIDNWSDDATMIYIKKTSFENIKKIFMHDSVVMVKPERAWD